MSSKYIKICDKCQNILQKKINNLTITFNCEACQSVYPGNEDDTLLIEVHTGKLSTNIKKGQLIYYNDANPKERRDCNNPKCDTKIIRYERRESDGKKIFGCKCGLVWMIDQSY